MLPKITLAGCSLRWSFPDSEPFLDWIEACPWRGEGGLRVLRTSLPSSELRSALFSAFFAREQGVDRLRIVHLQRPTRPLFKSLLAGLGLSIEGSAFDIRKRLIEAVRYSPVVYFTEASDESHWLHDEALDLIDYCSKVLENCGLTLLLIDRDGGTEAAHGGSFDFIHGFPIHINLVHRDSPSLAWPAYTHIRIAWESAGILEDARSLGDSAQCVPQENDSALEDCFTQFASERLKSTDEELISAATTWLDPRGQPKKRKKALSSLRHAGLLWRHAHDRDYRLAPWLARALLPQAPRDNQALLRWSLVCAPLHEAISRRCFEMEARYRDQGYSAEAERGVSSETCERMKSFQSGDYRQGRSYYPRSYPNLPQNPWDFASLGEILAHAPRSNLKSTLLTLRNHIAHGHYGGWSLLKDLRSVEAEFF